MSARACVTRRLCARSRTAGGEQQGQRQGRSSEGGTLYPKRPANECSDCPAGNQSPEVRGACRRHDTARGKDAEEISFRGDHERRMPAAHPSLTFLAADEGPQEAPRQRRTQQHRHVDHVRACERAQQRASAAPLSTPLPRSAAVTAAAERQRVRFCKRRAASRSSQTARPLTDHAGANDVGLRRKVPGPLRRRVAKQREGVHAAANDVRPARTTPRVTASAPQPDARHARCSPHSSRAAPPTRDSHQLPTRCTSTAALPRQASRQASREGRRAGGRAGSRAEGAAGAAVEPLDAVPGQSHAEPARQVLQLLAGRLGPPGHRQARRPVRTQSMRGRGAVRRWRVLSRRPHGVIIPLRRGGVRRSGRRAALTRW